MAKLNGINVDIDFIGKRIAILKSRARFYKILICILLAFLIASAIGMFV